LDLAIITGRRQTLSPDSGIHICYDRDLESATTAELFWLVLLITRFDESIWQQIASGSQFFAMAEQARPLLQRLSKRIGQVIDWASSNFRQTAVCK